ncbi:hypothetical protein WJX73_006659 [Symbiochloris irregularis]|uniref:Phosphotyrosine protein phosphatase I domain-containing protein n=1 Tax=Symbiochloris irregularis TaxID=706552 RepID=A0AAW1P188_9CHLO
MGNLLHIRSGPLPAWLLRSHLRNPCALPVRNLPRPFGTSFLPAQLPGKAKDSPAVFGRRRRTSVSLAVSAETGPQKVNVLFVCLGNICRSPSAEAVFKDKVAKAGLTDHFSIDSCGLGGGNEDWYLDRGWAYHEGHRADERMRETATTRGFDLTSRSRPLKPEDLTAFDYILGMDFDNMALMQIAADHWAATKDIPANYRNKVKLMCSFIPKSSSYNGVKEVPDPYWDDDRERRGFHRVLDLLEDACAGLLDTVVKEHGLQPK